MDVCSGKPWNIGTGRLHDTASRSSGVVDAQLSPCPVRDAHEVLSLAALFLSSHGWDVESESKGEELSCGLSGALTNGRSVCQQFIVHVPEGVMELVLPCVEHEGRMVSPCVRFSSPWSLI